MGLGSTGLSAGVAERGLGAKPPSGARWLSGLQRRRGGISLPMRLETTGRSMWGEKVRVTEGIVPCSRELSSYTTHQALSLAILNWFAPWTWAGGPMDCVHGGERPCKWRHID